MDSSILALTRDRALEGDLADALRCIRAHAAAGLDDPVCAHKADRIADEIGARREQGDAPLWEVAWSGPHGMHATYTRDPEVAAARADGVKARPELTLERHVIWRNR
ncbi:hypothetical protein [Marinitenerispora sediminis]|uniref:Uncharacterized protein n=1 Tax=Marinitenerispora sediminis TaxID=1931232 RepID=A0A368T730_9ACTN|nr:hypothetical protein [Marinitenerispora sediminis]RCV51194.1 hypothetical protein DEF23_20945 [Marinitenerispora sediminis]RCV59325.1 hypothetical protein DEF24_10155 [Marinitenerispora sediminis]